jgi:catechol 2,3-dioxygenase-like lactoylglutathione lyase family enzyme
MITKLSHATAYVLDQDEAKAFYTEKLGFEVRDDISLDGFRWLTVGPPSQPDLRIVLMPAGSGGFDPESATQLRALVSKGGLGVGVLATDDCHQTFKELSAKGVEFIQEPADRPYGIEAVFRDNSGNWYSLTQQRAQ